MAETGAEGLEAIPSKPEIIPQDPHEVIRRAEALGLVWKPLFDKVQQGLETAREISATLGLPNADGRLEAQVRNMRTALNMAFLEKERKEYPKRQLLETLYSTKQHPQEFINLVVTGKDMYYDASGHKVDLLGYLLDYYRFLLPCGFNLNIEMVSAKELKEKELNFIVWEEAMDIKRGMEAAGILDKLIKRRVSVPVLVMRDGECLKKVPILFSLKYLDQTGADAIYLYRTGETSAETNDDIIYASGVRPSQRDLRKWGIFKPRLNEEQRKQIREDFRSVPELAGWLVHEIDHVVFNFLHDSEERQIQEELVGIRSQLAEFNRPPVSSAEDNTTLVRERDLLAKMRELEHKKLFFRHEKKVGTTMSFEGLGQRAGRCFLEVQGRALAAYTKAENLPTGAVFLTDQARLENQVNLDMAKYAAGDILVSVAAAQKPIADFYTTDFLQKFIVKQPEAIKGILRHLITHYHENLQALNGIRKEKINELPEENLKIALKEGLGKGVYAFVLGREFFTVQEAIEKEIEDLPAAQIEAELDEWRAAKPKEVKDCLKQNDGNKKSTLQELKILARIKQRFNEEFDRLFQ